MNFVFILLSVNVDRDDYFLLLGRNFMKVLKMYRLELSQVFEKLRGELSRSTIQTY